MSPAGPPAPARIADASASTDHQERASPGRNLEIPRTTEPPTREQAEKGLFDKPALGALTTPFPALTPATGQTEGRGTGAPLGAVTDHAVGSLSSDLNALGS